MSGKCEWCEETKGKNCGKQYKAVAVYEIEFTACSNEEAKKVAKDLANDPMCLAGTLKDLELSINIKLEV